jgi:hypothetical protein
MTTLFDFIGEPMPAQDECSHVLTVWAV